MRSNLHIDLDKKQSYHKRPEKMFCTSLNSTKRFTRKRDKSFDSDKSLKMSVRSRKQYIRAQKVNQQIPNETNQNFLGLIQQTSYIKTSRNSSIEPINKTPYKEVESIQYLQKENKLYTPCNKGKYARINNSVAVSQELKSSVKNSTNYKLSHIIHSTCKPIMNHKHDQTRRYLNMNKTNPIHNTNNLATINQIQMSNNNQKESIESIILNPKDYLSQEKTVNSFQFINKLQLEQYYNTKIDRIEQQLQMKITDYLILQDKYILAKKVDCQKQKIIQNMTIQHKSMQRTINFLYNQQDSTLWNINNIIQKYQSTQHPTKLKQNRCISDKFNQLSLVFLNYIHCIQKNISQKCHTEYSKLLSSLQNRLKSVQLSMEKIQLHNHHIKRDNQEKQLTIRDLTQNQEYLIKLEKKNKILNIQYEDIRIITIQLRKSNVELKSNNKILRQQLEKMRLQYFRDEQFSIERRTFQDNRLPYDNINSHTMNTNNTNILEEEVSLLSTTFPHNNNNAMSETQNKTCMTELLNQLQNSSNLSMTISNISTDQIVLLEDIQSSNKWE